MTRKEIDEFNWRFPAVALSESLAHRDESPESPESPESDESDESDADEKNALDSLAVESKPLAPEIQTLVQENFWELAGNPLTVEPSEDVTALLCKIRSYGCESDADGKNVRIVCRCNSDQAAALITARDERIRRECADRAISYMDNAHNPNDYHRDGLRAAIMEAKK